MKPARTPPTRTILRQVSGAASRTSTHRLRMRVTRVAAVRCCTSGRPRARAGSPRRGEEPAAGAARPGRRCRRHRPRCASTPHPGRGLRTGWCRHGPAPGQMMTMVTTRRPRPGCLARGGLRQPEPPGQSPAPAASQAERGFASGPGHGWSSERAGAGGRGPPGDVAGLAARGAHRDCPAFGRACSLPAAWAPVPRRRRRRK